MNETKLMCKHLLCLFKMKRQLLCLTCTSDLVYGLNPHGFEAEQNNFCPKKDLLTKSFKIQISSYIDGMFPVTTGTKVNANIK